MIFVIFTKTVVSKFLSLGGSTNTISVSSERNTSLVSDDILQVFNSGLKSPTSNSSGDFEGVLEMDSNVISTGLDSY